MDEEIAMARASRKKKTPKESRIARLHRWSWLRLERLEDRVTPTLTAMIQGQPSSPWQFQGPGPVLNSSTNATIEASRPNPVVGAINAVVVNPNNPAIAYVGAVNGGIWKTENFGDFRPTWVFRSDGLPSQSISALAMDPNNSNVLYAGTRSSSSFFFTGTSGNGFLYRSTDAGLTWSVIDLPGTGAPLQAGGVWKLQVVCGRLFAATDTLGLIEYAVPASGPPVLTLVSVNAGVLLGTSFRDVVIVPGAGSSFNLFATALVPLPASTVFTGQVFSAQVDAAGTVSSWAVSQTFNAVTDLRLAGRTNPSPAAPGGEPLYAGAVGFTTSGGTTLSQFNELRVRNGTTGVWSVLSNLPVVHPGGFGQFFFAMAVDPTSPCMSQTLPVVTVTKPQPESQSRRASKSSLPRVLP
jgi:hypothetical protein